MGEAMTPDEMKDRTKSFGIQIVRFAQNLRTNRITELLSNQLVRAGTSVGANYRAACLGRSKAEFNAKLQIVLEEADESVYWLEILKESGLADGPTLERLKSEGKELTAICMSSLKTSRASM
jgi:four helix bundle protein